MRPNDPLWYKDAVIYQLHVKCFADKNGDGVGDFAGLIDKLDYIQSLGVTALWLLPFYPSPLRDDGYDIADYRGVHPRYGTMDDARALVDEAHRRGLRVITELVVNHTSDQHPWFVAARNAPRGSPEREFYVWSDTNDKYPETRIIFTDTERSNWAWDEVAGQYYWHRFFSHQPDLNHNNPAVVQAVTEVMDFWFDCGVDGLRLDAIPYLCVREGTNNENLPETHDALRRLREAVDRRHPGKMLLAEANQWPEDTARYFGDGDQCHMAFHFPLMPRLYLALARGDRRPMVEILEQTPDIPATCQWAVFLRNHDELTLEMVTDAEREAMYRHYAPQPRMRCNVGIRRRLGPLLDGDRRKVELLTGLLLSMPGTPIIYYGDELGMGDTIELPDRDGVRTPMQWDDGKNGGFSSAPPEQLYLPAIRRAPYGYQAVNVAAQQEQPNSPLNWHRKILGVRRKLVVFGRGKMVILRPKHTGIFAYLRILDDTVVLCVANLTGRAQATELDLSDHAGRVPQDLLGGASFPRVEAKPYRLTLAPYGFFWLRLRRDAKHTFEERRSLPEFFVLVLPGGADDLLAEPHKSTLEQQLLPRFIARQPGLLSDHDQLGQVALRPRPAGGFRAELTIVHPGHRARPGVLPLDLLWDAEAEAALSDAPHRVVAKLRHTARVGALVDARDH